MKRSASRQSKNRLLQSSSTGENRDSASMMSCSSSLPSRWENCTSPVEMSAKQMPNPSSAR